MKEVDYDIVILALPRWDGPYSSTAYSLARELARLTRVFYVDNPFTVKDFLAARNSVQVKRRRSALLSGEDPFSTPEPDLPRLTVVTPRLTVPINWLPSGFFYDSLARLNDSIVFGAISKLVAKYNVEKFVLINSFNPLVGRFFPKSFSPALTIYHCVDDISRSAYVNKHGTRLERQWMRRADITVVTSLELLRLKSKEAREVHYLPNAADVSLFRTALNLPLPIPADLSPIPEGKKVILYMGNICQRLDYELLRRIADEPDFLLLMVGPLSNDNYRKTGLDRLHNVRFMGRKDIQELPAYVKQSHCCIIPFLCNTLTKSIYPLKVNEYLSAGKPVVTTNFSPDIVNFASVAQVCEGHEDFIRGIRGEIETDSPEKQQRRAEFAEGNNWQARATDLLRLIGSKIGD